MDIFARALLACLLIRQRRDTMSVSLAIISTNLLGNDNSFANEASLSVLFSVSFAHMPFLSISGSVYTSISADICLRYLRDASSRYPLYTPADNAFFGAFNTTINVFIVNYHKDEFGVKWHLSMPVNVI